MILTRTPIEGCHIVTIDRHGDNRGYFQELFSDCYEFTAWKQANLSKSCKNVVRGIHVTPYPKLCTCVAGKLFDVVVDLRPDSPTYLKWYGEWLTAENLKQMFVPANCGHGFFAAEDDTLLMYLQGGTWNLKTDYSVHWQDPKIGIAWPHAEKYIVSRKDQESPGVEQ